MIETFDNSHDFDLIIVSVNHHQLDEVIEFIKPRLGNAILFMFNNIWSDPKLIVSQLPTDQIVWGFPGGGGGYISSNTLKGGFMKSITLGFVDNNNITTQYTTVKNLFEHSGFSISQKRDMRTWLWVHFAFNASLFAEATKINSYDDVFDSVNNIKQMVFLTREILPLIRKKGEKIGITTTLAFLLPAKLLGYVLKKAMTKGNLPRTIMEPMTNLEQLNSKSTYLVPLDVLNEAKQLNIKMPKLEKYEKLLKNKIK